MSWLSAGCEEGLVKAKAGEAIGCIMVYAAILEWSVKCPEVLGKGLIGGCDPEGLRCDSLL